MPEHDLLMQLNEKVNDLCTSTGRIEQKVDGMVCSDINRCAEYKALDGRVTSLEHKDMYRTGIAAGIALVVSWAIGAFR